VEVIKPAKGQLEEMGLVNVTLSEKGTVMGTLPANVEAIFRPLALSPMSTPHRILAVKC
jgi:tripeptide aminopeptidase